MRSTAVIEPPHMNDMKSFPPEATALCAATPSISSQFYSAKFRGVRAANGHRHAGYFLPVQCFASFKCSVWLAEMRAKSQQKPIGIAAPGRLPNHPAFLRGAGSACDGGYMEL